MRDSRRHLLFLAAVYAALQATLWLVIPARITWLTAAVVVLILGFTILHPLLTGVGAREAGLTGHDFIPALRAVLPPTLLAAGALIALGLVVPGGDGGHRIVRRFVQILPWALLQHGLLQVTFNRALMRAWGPGRKSALVNGLLFAGMHLPGPWLVLGTGLAGTWWSAVYQKRRNLWVLVLSHAVLSAVAQSFLPTAWTHGFRVGPGWFRWGPH